jgi:hypothetical protein
VRRGRDIPDKIIEIIHNVTTLGRNPSLMCNIDDLSVAKEHAQIEIV